MIFVEWEAEYGGITSYIAKGEDEEVRLITPNAARAKRTVWLNLTVLSHDVSHKWTTFEMLTQIHDDISTVYVLWICHQTNTIYSVEIIVHFACTNSDADKNTLLLVNQKLNLIKISGSGSKQLILIRLPKTPCLLNTCSIYIMIVCSRVKSALV